MGATNSGNSLGNRRSTKINWKSVPGTYTSDSDSGTGLGQYVGLPLVAILRFILFESPACVAPICRGVPPTASLFACPNRRSAWAACIDQAFLVPRTHVTTPVFVSQVTLSTDTPATRTFDRRHRK